LHRTDNSLTPHTSLGFPLGGGQMTLAEDIVHCCV